MIRVSKPVQSRLDALAVLAIGMFRESQMDTVDIAEALEVTEAEAVKLVSRGRGLT